MGYRDDDRRSRDRDDDRRGRDRDEDRGRERRRGDDRDDDRGRGRSRGGDFEYQRRSADSVRSRGEGGGDFDRFLKDGIKAWKPNDGDNRIRILPPTWKNAEHYGVDLYVHYGVGADRQSYLDLHKMLGKPDPINEERERFARDMDPDKPADKEYLRELSSTKRCLVYLIDRDHEKEGVQAWAMPNGLDRDIVKCSIDKDTGEVLPIDHPEDGYDVTFERNGSGVKTKYEGVSIARRSSPLGKREWLEYAIDNPLPDQLVYFDYDHIAKAFGGKGTSRDKDDDRGGDRRRDDRDDRDEGRRRERDDDRGGRDDRNSRSRDEKPELDWDSIHGMTGRELEDLIESEKLDINPDKAKSDEDLADWICEEMKITKKQERRRSAEEDDKPRERRRSEEDDVEERMRAMRDRRRD